MCQVLNDVELNPERSGLTIIPTPIASENIKLTSEQWETLFDLLLKRHGAPDNEQIPLIVCRQMAARKEYIVITNFFIIIIIILEKRLCVH